jgi:hypothetical protein
MNFFSILQHYIYMYIYLSVGGKIKIWSNYKFDRTKLEFQDRLEFFQTELESQC